MAIVTCPADELKKMRSASDWDKVDAMTDEELTCAILSGIDNPPLDEEIVSRMRSAVRGFAKDGVRLTAPFLRVDTLPDTIT